MAIYGEQVETLYGFDIAPFDTQPFDARPPVPRFGGLAWSVPLHGDIAMHVEAPDTGIAVHRDIPTDTIATLHEPGPDGIRVIQKVEDFS